MTRERETDDYTFLRFHELSDKPVDWRIQDLLRTTGNVLISAYRKAGKTSLILDLLGALTEERPFLSTMKCKPLDGPVVYVNIELEQSMLREYGKTMGIDIKRNENILIADYYGRIINFKLNDEDWREQFADQLWEVGAAALVIDPIHPLIAVHGGDSDSNDESRFVMEQLGSLRRMAQLDHLFIVDHTGHADKSRARGASGKEDWADVLWNIQRDEKSGQRHLDAIGRGVGGDVNYEQQKDGRLARVKFDHDGASAAGKPTLKGAVLAYLRQSSEPRTVAQICAETGGDRSQISSILNDEAKMNNVERRGKKDRAELWLVPSKGF